MANGAALPRSNSNSDPLREALFLEVVGLPRTESQESLKGVEGICVGGGW